MPPVAMTARAQGMASPDSSSTPVTCPFSARTSFAACPVKILAPPSLAKPTKASTMSVAWSETGNTRLPRSVLRGTPSPSKNAMVSAVEKAAMALYKNRPLPRTARIKSLLSQLLVTLHRPLPVIRTLRAGRSFFSSTATRIPRRAAKPAQSRPAAPPPMITASKWFAIKRCSPLLFRRLQTRPKSVPAWRRSG